MKVHEILERFDRFPVASFDDIAPGASLILAPHPDDESLGCGGFIAKAVMQGRPPVVVFVSDGAASHPGSRLWPPERLALRRQEESRNAANALGLSSDRLFFLGLQDSAVPQAGVIFEEAIEHLLDLAERHHCQNILVPWLHDPHCDHEAVWIMGQRLRALRPDIKLLVYPVWGLTLPPEKELNEEPPTGWRLNVEAFLHTKRCAIEAHRSQMGLVVEDDPTGFVLPKHLLEKMLQPYEIFVAS